jgi:four helix bundle protein
MLSFQRLDVYRCSIEFLARSVELPDAMPRGHAALADQLRRAALSVPLDIAEAAGRSSEADRARHFAIARGSAMECAAVMDALHVIGVLDEQQHAASVELLERIVSMLTRLCRPKEG